MFKGLFHGIASALKKCLAMTVKFFERIKKMIYKGSTAVEDVYVGGAQIGEVYKGDELVYQSSKIKYAGMSYVPAHSDGQGGWADGDGAQNAVRCLTLVLKNGAAKAIPFALYGDSVNLAPTDAQIASAVWVDGNYTSAFDSGVFDRNNSRWVPAQALGQQSGSVVWMPATPPGRSVMNGSLEVWGWPVTLNGQYTNVMVENYNIVVKGGVCYIYYQDTLVRKIRAK